MAERRMFAKSVIDTDLFLDMPMTSQALYFHLAMRADDDGFVSSPQKIKRIIGASDDDMKMLIAKQFILPFESGVIVIRHWKIHNYLRPDRYKPTIYQDEKSQLNVDNSNAYTAGIPSDSQMVTQRDTQYSIGKDSLDKDRLEIGEDEPCGSAPAPLKKAKSKPIRHKHGEYGHVLLTEDQYSKLIADFGESTTAEFIRKADEYVQMHGKTYRDYNLTIRNWINKDRKDGKNEPEHIRDNQRGEKEEISSMYATVL